jgi:hypothetical protein
MRLAIILMLGLPGLAWADEITVGKVPYTDVTITDVSDGNVTFTIPSSGSAVRKPLSEVTLIRLEGELAFNLAEKSAARAAWQEAVTGYDTAAKRAPAGWRKALIEFRLAQARQRLAPPPPPDKKPAGSPAETATGPAFPLATSQPSTMPEEEILSPLDQFIAAQLRKGNFGHITVPTKGPNQALAQDLAAHKKALDDFIKAPLRPISFLTWDFSNRKVLPESMDFQLGDQTVTREKLTNLAGPQSGNDHDGIFLEQVEVGSSISRNIQVIWVPYGYVEFAFPKDGGPLRGMRIHCQKYLVTHLLPTTGGP